MIKFAMIMFIFGIFGCAAQVQSTVPSSKVEVVKPEVKSVVEFPVVKVPVVESPPDVVVVDCADVNADCVDIKNEGRHYKAACLLNLKNKVDCKMMDNGNSLIITFTQHGQNRVECVKKAFNNPANQKALTKIYGGGVFFYSSSDRQMELL